MLFTDDFASDSEEEVNEPTTSTRASTPERSSTHDTSKIENSSEPTKSHTNIPTTKVHLVSTSTGGKENTQTTRAKQDPFNTKTTHQAQNIATGSGSTPGSSTGGTHQLDTPSGPDHNTKGSLQGEAGNRKIQTSLRITDTQVKTCLIKMLNVILCALIMPKMLIY